MSLVEQSNQHDLLTSPLARSGWYGRWGKRATDVAVSAVVLIAAAPLLVITLIGLRLQLGGGLVLRQSRIGRGGVPFPMLKLRTMAASRRETRDPGFHGPERRYSHKSKEDPRHTFVGRLARKFSIDELPQLVNVLRGDMSLVGPRPELTDVATRQFRGHDRHRVRPGLTGPYQVSSLRRGGLLEAGLGLDAGYARNVGFRTDLSLLVRTFGALVRGTGS